MARDIPLEKAVMAWNPKSCGGQFRVFEIPMPDRGRYIFTAGAVYTAWRVLSKAERMGMLFAEVTGAAVRDGVDFRVIAKALCVIPEFRAILADDVHPARVV